MTFRHDLSQRMVLLSGPRQCGKTTFSKQILKGFRALIEVKTSEREISPALIYFRDRLKVPHAIQLHTDTTQRQLSKGGVTTTALQTFLSQPLERRRFWELG